MSAKPTPGPYRIETHLPDRIRLIGGKGTCIAAFHELSCDGGRAEAEANARAWVDGMEAIERLKVISQILHDIGAGKRTPQIAIVAIGKVITKAKP